MLQFALDFIGALPSLMRVVGVVLVFGVLSWFVIGLNYYFTKKQPTTVVQAQQSAAAPTPNAPLNQPLPSPSPAAAPAASSTFQVVKILGTTFSLAHPALASWADARDIAASVSRQAGKPHRLPTPTEYAAALQALKVSTALDQTGRTYWTNAEGTYYHLDQESTEKALGTASRHGVFVTE